MSKRNFLTVFMVFCCVFVIRGAGVIADPVVAQPTTLSLTILHDNDLHGHLLSFAYTEIGKSPIEQPSRGGAARRATLVRHLRAEIKNPTILIDSGDIATRGPLINAYEGLADVNAMNAVGYDIAAIGNNEFKLKDAVDENDSAGAQAALLLVIKSSTFPWICANTTDSQGEFLQGVQPYVIRNFDGVRVGFLGLTAPRSASYPQTKGWIISDPIAAADKWISEARKHCDILIAVTHIGTIADEALAAKTTGIDAIVGGDSHTYLYKAVVVRNPAGVDVPIVQDGEFGVDLGRFDLHLARDSSGNWHLASYQYVLLPVDASIPEAPDVKAVLAPYVKSFEVVIGHVKEIAATPKLRTLQTTQVLVDAMQKETGADLALNTDGGGLFEVLRHKSVTRYDVYAALPFHDNVVIADLTGAQISAFVAANPTTIASEDITHLDPAKTYNVAFDDYEALDTYSLPLTDQHQTGLDERLAVIAYLRTNK
jgi:5'-nucleotidase